PGNVRELRNAVEQSYTLSRDQVILPEHLPVEVRLGDHVKLKKDDDMAVAGELVLAPAQESPTPASEAGGHEIVGETAASHTDVSDISSMVRGLLKESRSGEAYSYVMEKFEKELLRQSLEMHRWNQVQSAAHLGITRNTLRAKIEKYEL
ncbi:MAG: hypothetical protein KKB51_10130, partial [Candidatus Riflebacteria bacterium]|nr:hypothetical protein [Candidatus Riflebacteria bacterium]